MQENKEVYEVKINVEFGKSAKRFVNKKKFTKLAGQIRQLTQELEEGNFTGDIVKQKMNPAYTVYKKRLPNLDTKVGKSNGYRVIYIVMHENSVVGLLDIYYKKEDETLPDLYIEALIDVFIMELEEQAEQTEVSEQSQQ